MCVCVERRMGCEIMLEIGIQTDRQTDRQTDIPGSESDVIL